MDETNMEFDYEAHVAEYSGEVQMSEDWLMAEFDAKFEAMRAEAENSKIYAESLRRQWIRDFGGNR